MSKARALHQLAEVKRIGESGLESCGVRCKKKGSVTHSMGNPRATASNFEELFEIVDIKSRGE